MPLFINKDDLRKNIIVIVEGFTDNGKQNPVEYVTNQCHIE